MKTAKRREEENIVMRHEKFGGGKEGGRPQYRAIQDLKPPPLCLYCSRAHICPTETRWLTVTDAPRMPESQISSFHCLTVKGLLRIGFNVI